MLRERDSDEIGLVSDPLAEFGEALHTITRKHMQGMHSAILWNAINLLPPELWSSGVAHIYQVLTEGKPLRVACLSFADWKGSAGNLVRIAFRLMTEGEWADLQSGLSFYGVLPFSPIDEG